MADVLAAADRVAEPLGPDEPALAAIEQPIAMGWRWDAEDSETRTWFPQGITTSHDADPSGSYDGREVVLTAWAGEGHRGVRVSFAELGDDGPRRYRHVSLGRAVRTPMGVSLAPVRVHAGGLAWSGELLWVADTLRGLRAFSLERIFETASGEHVMPQVGAHVLSWPRALFRGPHFSFVSLTHDGGQPALLAGEYRNRRPGARLVRWPLPSANAPVRAISVQSSAHANLQGALSVGRALATAASAGTRPGRLMVSRDGAVISHPWATGPEDLAFLAARNVVLTATERPASSCAGCGRVVVGVPAAGLLG